jgi:hypothetical protein
MSHNRFVFAASLAILAMTAVGLDVLWQGDVRRRWWFWPWIALLVGLLLWCGYRTIQLPEPIATQLEQVVRQGQHPLWIADLAGVRRVQATYANNYAVAAGLCVFGIAGWLLLWFQAKWRRWFLPLLAGLLVADLLWFAYGRSVQCDPSLYYPKIPALEQVAAARPGRILGVQCLPAVLAQTNGLRDVRGYDAVDPARLMDVMRLAVAPNTSSPPYAITQWFLPQIAVSPSGVVRLPPVLDMLGVRYLVFRGSPPPRIVPDFSSPDYWVLTNPNALPRAFVPERLETIVDDAERLAEIVDEIPSRITVSLDMQTPGLVVLANLWDKGWSAYLDEKPLPILRTNHAVRGVVVPAGRGTLEFRYEPASFTWGLRFCGLAVIALAVWTGVSFRNSRKKER